MTERKGQHLFNFIQKTYNLKDDYSNLHSILFYMTDDVFDMVMKKVKSEE